MIHRGLILIADSDESFAMKASEMLEREGCQCDRARSLAAAVPELLGGRYDLAILEVQGGDHRGLERIGELLQHLRHLPVIVTTDSPTLESAIQTIHLKLHAYLIKPVNLGQLLQHVISGMTSRHLFSINLKLEQRIASAINDLAAIKTTLPSVSPEYAPLTLESLLTYTLHNIAVSVLDLKQLFEIVNHKVSDKGICHLLECPRVNAFTAILQETVGVLEKTRTAFKSKELADLRKKLGQIIVDINLPG
jgi:DNA-binding response OmpR family regulator